MMSRNLQSLVSILSVFVGFSLALYSQTNTATVTGVVTDPTGAAIPLAHLSIRSGETGVVKSVEANEAGQFTFNFIPIGTYNATVEAAGFQKLNRESIGLAAGQVLRLDLQLEVGTTQESVTVSTETPLLSLSSSDQLRTMN